MDLCQQEDGETIEMLQPETTYNPTIQYFQQVVTTRLANRSDDLPPVNDAIRHQMAGELDPNQLETAEFDEAF